MQGLDNLFFINHRVYYYETDKMGRVYHANFLNWMDEARTEYFKSKGIIYKELEEGGVFLPVTDIKLKYLIPVEYYENVRIFVKPVNASRIKIEFEYIFTDEEISKKYAEAFSINVFTNKEGKPERISKDLLEKIIERRI